MGRTTDKECLDCGFIMEGVSFNKKRCHQCVLEKKINSDAESKEKRRLYQLKYREMTQRQNKKEKMVSRFKSIKRDKDCDSSGMF